MRAQRLPRREPQRLDDKAERATRVRLFLPFNAL